MKHIFILANLWPSVLCNLIVSEYKVLKYFKIVKQLNRLRVQWSEPTEHLYKKKQNKWAKKSLKIDTKIFRFKSKKSLNLDKQKKKGWIRKKRDENKVGKCSKLLAQHLDHWGQLWTLEPTLSFPLLRDFSGAKIKCFYWQHFAITQGSKVFKKAACFQGPWAIH